MSMFTWDSSLSVNIEVIDDQHKKLLALINELSEATLQGRAHQVVGVVIAELVTYTDNHFALEEQLMREHGYPGLAMHKLEHDQLLVKVTELNAKSLAGHKVISLAVLDFLKNWLIHHIKVTDMQYKPFMNARGIR